jgi:hypothetical protein
MLAPSLSGYDPLGHDAPFFVAMHATDVIKDLL